MDAAEELQASRMKRRPALVIGLLLALGTPASPLCAAKTCSRKVCKPAISTNCAELRGPAKRGCRKKILVTCRARRCSCTGGAPPCEGSTISSVGGQCGGFILHPPICAPPLVCTLNPIPDTGGVCEMP